MHVRLCDCDQCCHIFFFFFKQKTAYEMRISDWSSDVCSSDLRAGCGGSSPYLAASKADSRACTEGASRRRPASAPRSTPVKSGSVESARLTFAVTPLQRSEERRVGKECVRTCRSRWSP